MKTDCKFDLVAGEDRHLPLRFLSRSQETGHMEPVALSGATYLLVLNDEEGENELARLDSEAGEIHLGNLVDREFVEAQEGEEVTAVMPIFDRELTLKLAGKRVRFYLFAVSGEGARQCILSGGISIRKVAYE